LEGWKGGKLEKKMSKAKPTVLKAWELPNQLPKLANCTYKALELPFRFPTYLVYQGLFYFRSCLHKYSVNAG
jgi:hypothetical protein